MRRLQLTFALIGSLYLSAQSQDLGSIDWKTPVKVNGGASMSWTGYSHGGLGGGKRDPLTYTITGNLGISILDWSIPLSFAYSTRQLSYSQPFNRIGISPRYKWVRLYGGYTSMSFSPYSLSGHSFLGAGVELSPGPYRFSVMYGRLNERIKYDPERQNTPCFTRMGYGAKVGYDVENTAVYLSVFTAKDDQKSIVLPSDTILRAKQNAVITLQGRQKVYEKFYVEGEYASSVLTNDINGTGTMRKKAVLGKMIGTNGSSIISDAFNVLVAYRGETASTELKYERVNPEYETLGSYYANNNFDNLTVAQTLMLKEGKINLSGNFGVERSNLVLRETNSDTRLVGSVSGTYTPSEKWSYSLSYSNFTSFTKVRPLDDPYFKDEMDSLSFYQVNQTASGSVSHSIMSGQNRHSIMFNGSYQRSSDKLVHRDTSNLSNFYNGTLMHSYSIKATGLSFSESFNYFYGNGRGTKTLAYGPTLSVSKAFLESKLTSALMCGYNFTEVNGTAGGKVLTAGLNGGYNPGKQKKDEKTKVAFRHRINGNVAFVKRFATPTVKGGHEITAVLTYAVSF
jgi:hypothetical protein